MKESQLPDIIKRYEMATFTVNRRINAMIKELMPEELTSEQYGIIRYIRANDRSTSSELAEVFCVGKSSITAIIARLVDKGHIQRIPDEKDRRVIYLSLTEEGRKISDHMGQVIQTWIEGIISHFEEDEAEQFIRKFEKLARVMTQHGNESIEISKDK